MKTHLALLTVASIFAGCAAPSTGAASSDVVQKTDAEYEAAVVRGLHDTVLGDVDAMTAALRGIAAGAPVEHGWGSGDEASITSMRAAWVNAREAYERIEGVIAPIFPHIDQPLDDRYEGFLAHLGATGGDPYLFDGRGVTGMHAIERILYVDVTPAAVIRSERTLPGYKAAAFPATAEEATDFRDKLCARALADAGLLRREWASAEFNASLAFAGLIDLMIEQREKVNKAASNEEESRYSQHTLADLRQNMVGTRRAYDIFAPWITSKPGGAKLDAAIRQGLTELGAAYDRIEGDAIPAPPETWSSKDPTPEDLATPFGSLYTRVRTAVDPNVPTSVVSHMNEAAALLGFEL
jgi:iron uptake system component EfeO